MKPSYVAVGVVGLALGGLWYAAGGAQPPAAQAALHPWVSDPVSHENLTVYFVHGPDALDDSRVVTLQEALALGMAVVHETGSVNELVVENRSADRELFVQSGDMIKGGRQDRLIAVDMLVPPGAGRVGVRVHCVEAGRWAGRPNEEAARFSRSDNYVVGNDTKFANAAYQQSAVWESVKENQDKLSKKLGVQVNAAESPTSLQLALENPAVREKVSAYESALRPAGEGRRGVVGAVFVINGRVTGAEVYGSNGLFRRAWPKLLGSASVEALAEKTDRRTPVPPSPREVELFLASAAKADEGAAAGPAPAEADARGFAGRSTATRNRLVRSGEGRESGPADVIREVADLVEAPNQPPAANLNPAEPADGVQTLNRNFDNWADTRGALPARAQPAAGQQPANPAGNRLNTNRVENRSTLMLESRDPARNAVIHRSYLKK